MREITSDQITETVEKLCIKANCVLPEDIAEAFRKGAEQERSPLGKEIFERMEENRIIAEARGMPVCQDTGMAVIFAEVGQEVHITGGPFEEAVNEGVRRGYLNGFLRLSVVSDPLRRENTNDNTPAVIHTRIVPGEALKLIVAPKGFGSENMSALKMFNPSADKDSIIDFIVDMVKTAGSNPCPPVIVGVGIGGTAELASLNAKKALLRPVGKHSGDPF
jgi:fumarate hydratase subunit alpha